MYKHGLAWVILIIDKYVYTYIQEKTGHRNSLDDITSKLLGLNNDSNDDKNKARDTSENNRDRNAYRSDTVCVKAQANVHMNIHRNTLNYNKYVRMYV